MELAIGLALGAALVGVYFWTSKNSKSKKAAEADAQDPGASSSNSESVPEVRSPSVSEAEKSKVPTSEPKNIWQEALKTTRGNFFSRIENLFGKKKVLSDDEMEQLEEILYTSDLGPKTIERMLESVKSDLQSAGESGIEVVRSKLKGQFKDILQKVEVAALEINQNPFVILIVGVNGAGKTTTIGKLSALFCEKGLKVLVAAGDTFRAAASSQLRVWSERAAVEIFDSGATSDPSAIAFSALERAKSQGSNLVLIDTAGRLHTQKNLMEELKKVKRVMAKVIETAPHEVFLVLDANTGQNALQQAREFHQALGVTGIILTKLDGSSRGGVAIAIADELKIPIRYVGLGEKLEDLKPFSAEEFVDAIL